ncbi:hypothetical protein JCM13591A_23670 [Microbacterium xylanilyticum]
MLLAGTILCWFKRRDRGTTLRCVPVPVLRQAQQPLDRNTTLTAAVTGLPRSVLLTPAVDRSVLPRAPR